MMVRLHLGFVFALFAPVTILVALPSGAESMAQPTAYNVGTVSLDRRGLTFRLAIWDRKNPRNVVLNVGSKDPGYSEMLKLAVGVNEGQTKPLPLWHNYIGILTMSADGHVTCYTRMMTNEGDAIFESVFKPGSLPAKQYAELVGGLLPGQTKPLPPWPESVGVASMGRDGTITAYLRSEAPGEPIAEARIIYKPGDPQYSEIVEHIGGIKPGEVKSIPPWK